jgi:hypothetical protein
MFINSWASFWRRQQQQQQQQISHCATDIVVLLVPSTRGAWGCEIFFLTWIPSWIFRSWIRMFACLYQGYSPVRHSLPTVLCVDHGHNIKFYPTRHYVRIRTLKEHIDNMISKDGVHVFSNQMLDQIMLADCLPISFCPCGRLLHMKYSSLRFIFLPYSHTIIYHNI